jgi:hypothetical protein
MASRCASTPEASFLSCSSFLRTSSLISAAATAAATSSGGGTAGSTSSRNCCTVFARNDTYSAGCFTTFKFFLLSLLLGELALDRRPVGLPALPPKPGLPDLPSGLPGRKDPIMLVGLPGRGNPPAVGDDAQAEDDEEEEEDE